jgi:hypothetical protein
VDRFAVMSGFHRGRIRQIAAIGVHRGADRPVGGRRPSRGRAPLEPYPHIVRRLTRRRLEPIDASQLIHGDPTGNILSTMHSRPRHETSLYWRPPIR